MKIIDITRISIRFQTTIPKDVRKILNIKGKDKLAWILDEKTGKIYVEKIS